MHRELVETKVMAPPMAGMTNVKSYLYGEYSILTSLDEFPTGEALFHLSVAKKGQPVEIEIVEELWSRLAPPHSKFIRTPAITSYGVAHFYESRDRELRGETDL